MVEKNIEKEARRLRDKVFGQKVSDEGWEAVKEKWVADIAWLREEAGEP